MASKLLQTRILPNTLIKNSCTSSSLPQSSTVSFFNHEHLHSSSPSFHIPTFPSNLLLKTSRTHRDWFVTTCFNRSRELIHDSRDISVANEESVDENSREREGEVEDEVVEEVEKKELADQSIWVQMKEIIKFTAPAMGLWICGSLMSLIDTAVIGQGSSIELAALGPATVMSEYISYLFMFLSIATSNMVATALAKQDSDEVQHHISVLLLVGLACGVSMLLFVRFFGESMLTAFTGPKNLHLVPAASTYVKIRGLAWPALLAGWVAQSASLGMKDSWGPLKALAAATAINAIGAVVLCIYLGYGIAGAAWAGMAAQVVAGFMMLQNLQAKGYNAFALSIPSAQEFFTIVGMATPLFLTLISKVAFFALLVYFSTSMGTLAMAAHQVMVQTYLTFTVWGEPLSQTAQSFMPELIYGGKQSLAKARELLRSLIIIGVILGLLLGIVGTSVPWLFPRIFTPDQMVIQEMHKVLIPFFMTLAITPLTLSLEGTLLAGRDLRFISLSTGGCFTFGAFVLLMLSSRYGFQGCWFALAVFQWARFSMALQRVLSPNGMLFSEDFEQFKQLKVA
ncbi:hypothetical protein K1719_000903 [Acacia pycnantha]|nr:hypothetical protein K1719_000903 [Acacia pycnantha]